MDQEDLLELFDRAGLPPSVSYTKACISRHKRQVSCCLTTRPEFSFVDENGLDRVYALNTVQDAIDRILAVIETDGLAFYHISDSWQSHWNPRACDEQWTQPIPDWGGYLVIFRNDRLKRATETVDAIARDQYDQRVWMATKMAEFTRLKEELFDCQNRSDSLEREKSIRDLVLGDLMGVSEADQVDKQAKVFKNFLEMESLITTTRDDCRAYREARDERGVALDQAVEEIEQYRAERRDRKLTLKERTKQRDHYWAGREDYKRQLREMTQQRDCLEAAMSKVEAERGQLWMKLELVTAERDTLEMDGDTDAQKQHECLAALSKSLEHLAKQRRRRRDQLKVKIDRRTQVATTSPTETKGDGAFGEEHHPWSLQNSVRALTRADFFDHSTP
ncbi:hypothetical protein ACEPPN_000338 [Leptodophora sp. 'Broadleaf-Isolate-01']